jgi:YVTN family beta-propeller protein
MVLVDDRFLYVALAGDNKVTIIDTTTNTVDRRIRVGQGPIRMTLVDEGEIIDVPGTPAKGGVEDRRIYTANGGDNTISVFSLALNAVLQTLEAIEGITDIAYSQHRNILYVTENKTNTVVVIESSHRHPGVNCPRSGVTGPHRRELRRQPRVCHEPEWLSGSDRHHRFVPVGLHIQVGNGANFTEGADSSERRNGTDCTLVG